MKNHLNAFFRLLALLMTLSLLSTPCLADAAKLVRSAPPQQVVYATPAAQETPKTAAEFTPLAWQRVGKPTSLQG